MTIAKRLMTACAGVVIAGLGFFAPRADASVQLSLQVDPTPPGSVPGMLNFIVPTYNSSTGHYTISGDTTNGAIVFDVIAKVSGSVNGPVTTQQYGLFTKKTLYTNYPAEGIDSASGSIVLNGATGVLNGAGGIPSGIDVGLVAGDVVGDNSGQVPLKGYYDNTGKGATTGQVIYADGSVAQVGGNGTKVAVKLGSNSTISNDTSQFNNFQSVALASLPNASTLYPNNLTSATLPQLSDPTQPDGTFVLGKFTLFLGTTGASAGTLQLGWQAAPSTVTNAAQWFEDAITGVNSTCQVGAGTPAPIGSGGYYTLSQELDPTTGSVSVLSPLALDIVVPEPATLGLFAVGALVCGLRRNRRK